MRRRQHVLLKKYLVLATRLRMQMIGRWRIQKLELDGELVNMVGHLGQHYDVDLISQTSMAMLAIGSGLLV